MMSLYRTRSVGVSDGGGSWPSRMGLESVILATHTANHLIPTNRNGHSTIGPYEANLTYGWREKFDLRTTVDSLVSSHKGI